MIAENLEQPDKPTTEVSCDVSCDNEPSGEAAVLEVQEAEQDEQTSKASHKQMLPKENKSSSALMRSSGRQSEEEGGVRIIRYNNKEPSHDGE